MNALLTNALLVGSVSTILIIPQVLCCHGNMPTAFYW